MSGMKTFKSLFLSFVLLWAAIAICADAPPARRVIDRKLVSDALPSLRIQLKQPFHYIGSFSFQIEDMAAGERFVFLETEGKNVRRMFVAQFESILPRSSEIYRYNFENAMKMGQHSFRHNTFAFSVAEARKEAPGKEADLTARFLEQKGFIADDEWMASRFLTLGDESRKHEMILFYMEPVASSGYHLSDFYKGEEETDVWKKLSAELRARSLEAFTILPRF